MSAEEAHKNVLWLYKSLLKKCKWMKGVYHIPMSIPRMKERVRAEFMKHADVRDLRVLDFLLMDGMEKYEDCLFHHTQRGHVLDFFSVQEPLTALPEHKANEFFWKVMGDKQGDVVPKFSRKNLIE